MDTTVHVWWTDLRDADLRLRDSLPEAERLRVDALAEDADRARRLLGAVTLQHALRRARGLADDTVVEIDRTCPDCGAQHGPPRPADGAGPHVSVSHSGLLVVVASCESAAVGVDVERITDRDLSSWTAHEARLKAGTTTGRLVSLRPPIAGYAAALAVAHGPEVSLTIHHPGRLLRNRRTIRPAG